MTRQHGFILTIAIIFSFLLILLALQQLTSNNLIKITVNRNYDYLKALQAAEEGLVLASRHLEQETVLHQDKVNYSSHYLGRDVCGRKIYLLKSAAHINSAKINFQRRYVDESTKNTNCLAIHIR